MKKLLIPAMAAGLMVTGCATNDRYGYGYDDPYRSSDNDQRDRALKGAAIGAAAGAVGGAVVKGVSTVEGAAIGAAAGAVLGAVIKGKQYYRDTRGNCYYVDKNGNPVYDYDTKC
ncbi:YMGG-like glycine zipper-containing protein [Sphingomicrobium sp. XHP0235]|uniref:YMGG-like glycine zipper-containing protein n=1 Tax=Sphingomicrobium aquimarinum TaxID=3133971 RepID=UPI0031FE601E